MLIFAKDKKKCLHNNHFHKYELPKALKMFKCSKCGQNKAKHRKKNFQNRNENVGVIKVC